MLDDNNQATVIIGILRGGGSTCVSGLPKKYQDTTTEWTKVSLFITWIKDVMQHKGTKSFMLKVYNIKCLLSVKVTKGVPATATSLGGLRDFNQQEFANRDDQYYYSEELVKNRHHYFQNSIKPYDCLYNKKLGKVKLLEDCDTIGRIYSIFSSFN